MLGLSQGRARDSLSERQQVEEAGFEVEDQSQRCPPKEEWQLLLVLLKKERFPCLENVAVIIDFQSREGQSPDISVLENINDGLNGTADYHFRFKIVAKERII